MTESEIRQKVEEYSHFPVRGNLRVLSDTTEFMTINAGDVLELDGVHYLVRGEEVEGRFGLDGEPKFWVKKAVDLRDGKSKIIKLVFYETFVLQLGDQKIQCYRSPGKEARILDKTRGDLSFMQGENVQDSVGNAVRIIDRIEGRRFYDFILESTLDHETYFHTVFPSVLDHLIDCFEALNRLHHMSEVHGDVRNDHVFIERGTGRYRWIDFDYAYQWTENPFGVDLFGLGNILLLATGKGFHVLPHGAACAPTGMDVVTCLEPADLSLFFKHRIINLKKLFPYIPESLNQLLLHFSQGAEVFYETTEELLHDLRASLGDLPHTASGAPELP